jgi:ectoine hydroxylase-related dioxygenase (phytanoyl-CoA dioxygenase family)
MRQIFRDDIVDRRFQEDGYVVVDLLSEAAMAELWDFYRGAFAARREVVAYARDLPYYISIFDADPAHKREADARISRHVEAAVGELLDDYEVFYSNYMIKFPGDGEIEAHQDFNFVDESRHTAFNLWCPLVETDLSNGGLCVIPGSHRVFRTQRGPNIPKALTQYNDRLKRYARWVPVRKGQAAIFDHKLIHCSPPNATDRARVAVQSVLKPREAEAVHCVYDEPRGRVKVYRIDKSFVLDNNLWDARLEGQPLDHEEDLIPFPSEHEVTRKLVDLTLAQAGRRRTEMARRVFKEDAVQRAFQENGFVTLPVLGSEDVQQLTALFQRSTGGAVENTEYGMYIGLEERDLPRKRALIQELSALVVPRLREHFVDCKPHLGSFLAKAPGEDSYTYPHQDWTFVDTPEYVSMTAWIALVDTSEKNGALGFVRGSHSFFDKPVGSPSPDFQTCTQGHEAILYEYLEFVPLTAGEAVVFDNRTIHGAPPNRTSAHRLAVAIGMTPREAQLHHYFLVPGSVNGTRRAIAKLKVDGAFFEQHTVASLKALFDRNELPGGCERVATLQDEFVAFSADEMRRFCEQSGLPRNGRELVRRGASSGAVSRRPTTAAMSVLRRVRRFLARPSTA